MNYVIADITKAFPGTASKVLERVTQNVIADDLKLTVLLHEDQLAELKMSGINMEAWQLRPISRMTSVNEVALQMALQASTQAPFTLFFSFRAAVLALAPQIDKNAGAVYFLPWSKALNYLNNVKAGRAPDVSPNTPLGAAITDDEALAVLKAVLQEAGASTPGTAIKQTTIRPRLSQRDARFYRTNPTTNMPGYITRLIARAQGAGVVSIVPDAVNPAIWLQSTRMPDRSVTGVASNDGDISSSATTEPAAALTGTISKSPSERYADILRNQNMGPFPNLRDDLYDALGQLAVKKLPLDKLITACLTMAQQAHPDPKDKKIPWRTSVRNFLIKLLTRNPVLLDEAEKPITPSFHTGRTTIHKIAPQFKEILDGELILFLLQQGAEIKFEDRGALIGALYMTREAKYDDLLSNVLGHLQDTGAIQYGIDGIQLAPPASGTVTALHRP